MVLDDDPHVTAQYEQFEIDRHILLLDWRNAPERDAAVRALQGRLTHPDSNMELAKALERRGFHREAIPVYHYDAIQRDRDYAPLQGLFDAASEALEPAPALAVIERIHSREFPAPPGLTIDYLNEQHARFLLLDRNLEESRRVRAYAVPLVLVAGVDDLRRRRHPADHRRPARQRLHDLPLAERVDRRGRPDPAPDR